jgi:hypothetical protein
MRVEGIENISGKKIQKAGVENGMTENSENVRGGIFGVEFEDN